MKRTKGRCLAALLYVHEHQHGADDFLHVNYLRDTKVAADAG